MIRRQWLVVKNIQSGVADVAAFKRRNKRYLVGKCATCGVYIYDTLLHARDSFGGKKAARLVAKGQIHRYHIGAGKQHIDVDQWNVDLSMFGTVPADYIH